MIVFTIQLTYSKSRSTKEGVFFCRQSISKGALYEAYRYHNDPKGFRSVRQDVTLDSIYTSLWERRQLKIIGFDKEPDIIREQLFNDDIEKGAFWDTFETNKTIILLYRLNDFGSINASNNRT